MEVYYGNKKVKNNDFLTPNETSKKPKVIYEGKKYYSLVMIDPDAIHGIYIHWAVINIPGNKINKGKVILEYQGPAPPQYTGYHRYFLMLFELENPIKNIEILQERIISRDKLETLLTMYKPKYKIMFVSKNVND